jgi:hypothetical protein
MSQRLADLELPPPEEAASILATNFDSQTDP